MARAPQGYTNQLRRQGRVTSSRAAPRPRGTRPTTRPLPQSRGGPSTSTVNNANMSQARRNARDAGTSTQQQARQAPNRSAPQMNRGAPQMNRGAPQRQQQNNQSGTGRRQGLGRLTNYSREELLTKTGVARTGQALDGRDRRNLEKANLNSNQRGPRVGTEYRAVRRGRGTPVSAPPVESAKERHMREVRESRERRQQELAAQEESRKLTPEQEKRRKEAKAAYDAKKKKEAEERKKALAEKRRKNKERLMKNPEYVARLKAIEESKKALAAAEADPDYEKKRIESDRKWLAAQKKAAEKKKEQPTLRYADAAETRKDSLKFDVRKDKTKKETVNELSSRAGNLMAELQRQIREMMANRTKAANNATTAQKVAKKNGGYIHKNYVNPSYVMQDRLKDKQKKKKKDK